MTPARGACSYGGECTYLEACACGCCLELHACECDDDIEGFNDLGEYEGDDGSCPACGRHLCSGYCA